jgi:RHS repeat-associated protein
LTIEYTNFDQLGRVRLTRSIENVLTEDPYNEQHGIKVQTRYETGNPYLYQLSSNPYRTMNEAEMGWTRSKSINTGKHGETETFSGASLPAPWGTNVSSTGKVQTDIDGERTLVTDQAGKQRISKTNALGQLLNVWEVKTADADTEAITFGSLSLNALKTSYQYDTLNNLKQVNQGVQTRTFAYSSLSRLLSANNPESGLISYKYDVNGNLSSKTDARTITTNYNYDLLNRVTLRDYSDTTPDVTYTYDNGTNAKGKLTKVTTAATATNQLAETKYNSFDILGRVLSHSQITDGNTYNSSYIYNLSGALIEETYPSGRVVKNTLDIDGDLAQVQSKKFNDTFKNYANAFTYTSAGAVSSLRLGNGKFENTTFNSRLQPIQIGLGSSATSQNLLKLNFDYGTTDNNGNLKSQIITTPTVGNVAGFVATQVYSYDSLNRIQQATETVANQPTQGWQQTFVYDRYGNRTFDAANTTTLPKNCGTIPNKFICATDIPKFNPTANALDNKLVGTNYDSVGNTKIDANGQVFTYDAENKQTKVVNAQGVTVGEYFYDGDGKRVKKIAPLTNETTIFVYDAAGKTVAEYSTISANQADAKINYTTTDHLGSPRINTDANGNVIARHDTMPFGEEIQRANYGSDNLRNRFTSYERDGETGLDYAKARMFGSGVGRFTSPDPMLASGQIGSPQTWNRYAYVDNNPLNFTDPLGLYKFGASLEDSNNLSDAERKKRKGLRENFEAGLKKANDNLKIIEKRYGKGSTEYQEASRGVSAYGTLNDNTKVLVDVGGKTGAEVAEKTDKNGNARVLFSESQLKVGDTGLAGVTGHEGIHVSNILSGKSISKYEDERQGNWVQSVLAEANYKPSEGIGLPSQEYAENGYKGGEIYNSSWGTGTRTAHFEPGVSRTYSIPEAKRHAAVAAILRDKYNLTPPASRK